MKFNELMMEKSLQSKPFPNKAVFPLIKGNKDWPINSK